MQVRWYAVGIGCDMACYSPLAGYVNKENGGIVFKKSSIAGKEMQVACGQCLGCRLDRGAAWAARIVHESMGNDENCFITLTYRSKADCTREQLENGWYMPEDGSLVKSHFQKFMKRLRKSEEGRRIRYYQVGEYGEKLERPHYHAVLFNYDFADKELLKESEGIFLFTSETLEKLWPYGFSTTGDVTYESAAYCARYVLKKITGIRAQDHYLRCDEDGVAYWLLPEYTTMSLGHRCKEHRGLPVRPKDCEKCSGGIGANFYEEFKGDIFPSDEVPVPGKGVFKKVPRYYEGLLEHEDPDMFGAVKAERQLFIKKNLADYTPERLMDRYKVKMAMMSNITRDGV